jgi:hypothetical protein
MFLSGPFFVVRWLGWNYESMAFWELDLNFAPGRLGCREIMRIFLEIGAKGLVDLECSRVLGVYTVNGDCNPYCTRVWTTYLLMECLCNSTAPCPFAIACV